jgi:hypothetical protein
MFNKNAVGWTKAEKERIRQALRLGCCVTGATSNLEVHHLLSGGKRMGHGFTGVLAKGLHQKYLANVTSLADGSKPFTAAYGTQRSLWEATQRRLGLPCNWAASKIVPRRLVQESTDVWD